MTIPITSASARMADPVAQSNLSQAPPRPVAAPAARPAAAARPEPGSDSARAAAINAEELEAELTEANRKLSGDGHELRFEYDRDANRLIVRLVELGTQKVLRQYPSDEALRVARLVRSGKPLISMLV